MKNIQDSFLFNDKVSSAIIRLQTAYEVSNSRGLGSLYVCFSGGKDSVCIAYLCKLAGVPYELHYNVTGIDYPELVYFIRQNYPDCHFDLYDKSMWQLIVEKHYPPTRLARYCCAELKEHGGEGRFCVTGVRRAESYNRSTRTGFEVIASTKSQKILFNDNEGRNALESCDMKRKLVVNPIIDWTDSDVWSFIHFYSLPYCKLYDCGFTRLGCIGCPLSGSKNMKRDFELYPKYKQLYLNAFDKMLANMTSYTWRTGQDVFDWWIKDIDK